MARRKESPEVAAYYLALTDDERSVLDKRIEAAGRVLADMRLSRSTGKLDERLLVPKGYMSDLRAGRLADRQRNADGTIVAADKDPDDVSRKGLPKTAGLASRRFANKRLGKDQTLASYINDQLSDGIELAHFYLDLLRMPAKDCRSQGIFMNHKIQAATWLGERGWGRPKGEEKDASVTINVVNHADAITVPPPVKQTVIEATKIADADPDAGKDEPRMIDYVGMDLATGPDTTVKTTFENGHVTKIDEDFELEDVR